MAENLKNLKHKNPALVGFFAFVLFLFLWLWALQFVSRGIFVFHRNTGFWDSFQLWFQASYYGFKLDLASITYGFLVILLIAAIGFLLKSKWIYYLSIIPAVILTLLTILVSFGDAELNHFWGSKFNGQVVEFLKHPTEAMASTSEAKWWVILPGIVLFGFLFTYSFFRLLKHHAFLLQYRFRMALSCLLVAVVSAPLARGGFQTIPINQSSAYYSEIPFHNHAAVNSFWNMMFYLTDPSTILSSKSFQFDLPAESKYQEAYFGKMEDTAVYLSPLEKPNVVIFILESFSSHTSEFFGHVHNSTPYLDSLARTGLAFTNAYAQGDRTAKGLAAALSGWPGQPNQSKSLLTLTSKAAKLPGIAQVARKKGYKTMFFYGGEIGFDNMLAYNLSSGYQSIMSDEDFDPTQRGKKWGAHDQYVFARAVDSLSLQKEPFFGTILSLSSHEPFEIPGEVNSGSEDQRFLKSIAYTDRCIKEFMKKAKTKPWFNNTVFVFVADHGRRMEIPDMQPHQPKFYQIPIIFWGPALHPTFVAKTNSGICSQMDIPATVTESLMREKTDLFEYSRNLVKPHAEVTYYQFADGFGMVSPDGHVVWSNPQASIMEFKGNVTDLLLCGKAFQWQIAKKFEKL